METGHHGGLLIAYVEKAHDRIYWGAIFDACTARGIDAAVVWLSLAELAKTPLSLMFPCGPPCTLHRLRGLPQGCPSAPLLFGIIMEDVLDELTAATPAAPITGANGVKGTNPTKSTP